MSEIESLIYKFNSMCGESETEMGNLALAELKDLREMFQAMIEVFETHERKLYNARDLIIEVKICRLINGDK